MTFPLRCLLGLAALLVAACHQDIVLFSSDGGTIPVGDAARVGPSPRQCATTVERAVLCFENASGRPGDRVEIEVHVLVPEGCGPTGDQGGGIALGRFELDNPRSYDGPQGACLRREVMAGSLEWGQATAGTLPGCPPNHEPGLVDRLRLRIPVGLSSGQYLMVGNWGLVEHEGGDPRCGTMTAAQGPTITVFP